MKKIMFVCLGNICRSPMAEFILKHLVKDRSDKGEFVISSSATSSWELGNDMYPPAKAELKRRNVSFERRRATLLKKSDYDDYDLFLVMDNENLRDVKRLFNDTCDKVKLLKSYSGGGEIADPWYTRDFKLTADEIFLACENLLKSL